MSAPFEALLISGGDPRLNVDPATLLNRFGCHPRPRPEALTFASSTATNISSRGFAAAAAMHQQLLNARGENYACERQAEWLRNQLRAILRLDPSVEIVFSPSGTDSEIHVAFIAQTVLRHRSPGTGPFVNIIVAADETGSGVPHAAVGRHFSAATSQGATVACGGPIAGFPEDVTNVAIRVRHPGGALRSVAEIDSEVLAAVAQSVAAGQRVLLHAMDSSKFGTRAPTLDCLRHIHETWRDSVQIVVDACQLRTNRRRLASYLNHGFLVLITGSKFFAGPPFSGALLIPAAVAAILRGSDFVPAGLALYSNRHDWPLRWRGVRSQLPAHPNIGQLLRWAAAIAEMRAYFDVPQSYRWLALQTFCAAVERLLLERPDLQLLPSLDDQDRSTRTIFPFSLRRSGQLLSLEDCDRIYRALQSDTSPLLPISAVAPMRQIASQSCHIGQPVLLKTSLDARAGTLRISASARLASETWCPCDEAASVTKLQQYLEQLGRVFEKIDLLVDNLDAAGSSAVALQVALANSASRPVSATPQSNLVAS